MLEINKVEGLYLGVRGENGAREIVIDASAWAAGYPNASLSIWHKRPGSQTKNATGASYDPDTGIITWSPSSEDTYNAGQGVAEIRMTENGNIRKTRDIPTVVSPSLVDGSGQAVDSNWQAYMNEVEAKKQLTIAQRQTAEAWAVGQRGGVDVGPGDETYENNARFYALQAGGAVQAEITAERWAVGQHNGIDVDPGDVTYHNNAKYYAERSAASANTAGGSATQASGYATAAGNSATAAQQSAGNAQTYAGNAQAYAQQSATAAREAVSALFVDDFKPNKSYPKGGYCRQNGTIYRFTAPHSGAWTGTDVEETSITGELSGINSGAENKAFHHLGLYLDGDGDLCQAD